MELTKNMFFWTELTTEAKYIKSFFGIYDGINLDLSKVARKDELVGGKFNLHHHDIRGLKISIFSSNFRCPWETGGICILMILTDEEGSLFYSVSCCSFGKKVHKFKLGFSETHIHKVVASFNLRQGVYIIWFGINEYRV